MTSGEWDLRALKALEEEEQKEFLALSQKSLFEPPSPPVGAAVDSSPPPAAKQATTLSYAQLHPHLLKLPTIDECQLIAAAKRNSLGSGHASGGGGGSNTLSTGRLKFTRALSLSAHSLTSRGGSSSNFGKKLKSKLVGGTKSSGSLSPSHYSYTVSPVYTPPPIRRCATLHHTQPVRKTFKTLQQLERQKQERKQQQQAVVSSSHRSPQLQRVVGTGKTFWKYGINSTAASIVGQRAQAKRGQKSDVESNTSDERQSIADAEAAANLDLEDSATETGSCSVPLPPTNTNEMLRLMLTAATTAVNKQLPSVQSTTPDIAATGGGDTGHVPAQQQQLFAQPAYLTLTRCHQPPSIKVDPDKTVAYEAFHALTRRKSFGHVAGSRTLLRAGSLTAKESQATAATTYSVNNNRKILKSTSMDAANAMVGGTEQIVEYKLVSGEGNQLVGQRSTIITNPIVEGIKTVAAPTTTVSKAQSTIKSHHMCNLPKAGAIATATTTAAMKKFVDRDGSRVFNETDESHHHAQVQAQAHHHRQHLQEMEVACYAGTASSPDGTSPPLIDDELEQHIKHCSCSCNHMGYGNSMDYQVSFSCNYSGVAQRRTMPCAALLD